MNNDINNILIYNSGGGLGDTISTVPLIEWLKKKYNLDKIYYIQNGPNKYFQNSCKDIYGNFVYTLNNLPDDFGFISFFKLSSFSHIKIARNLLNNLKIEKFDMIIDLGTRVKNTLVLKQIPHKFFISPAAYFMFSNPKKIMTKSRHVIKRIFDYFELILKIKINIPLALDHIPQKYMEEARKILGEKTDYVGFSITAGHPTRRKEFSLNAVIEVANHFADKNYIPAFFVEEKHKELIDNLKNSVKNVIFPEHQAKNELKNPLLVIALAKHMKGSITIDNGIMHMLSLSGTKTATFFASKNFCEKFKSLNISASKNYYMKNRTISELNSGEIIKFVENFI